MLTLNSVLHGLSAFCIYLQLDTPYVENHQEWQQKHCEKAQRGADDARGEVFKSAEDGRPGMWELLGVSAEERGEENTDEQKRRGSEHPARVKCTKEGGEAACTRTTESKVTPPSPPSVS